MRTLWLLEELGLDCQLVIHDFGPALRSPEYLAISPLGRVPALQDGGDTLIESGAICEWLCERHSQAGLGRAPGHPERAEWLQWLHFAETVGQHLAALTQQHIVIRDDHDRSPLIMKLELRRLEKALGVLEAVLEGRDWMLVSGFSGIDTGIGYSVYVAEKFADLEQFPNVAGYLDRIRARLAFQAALPPPGSARIYTRPFYAAWPADRG